MTDKDLKKIIDSAINGNELLFNRFFESIIILQPDSHRIWL